MQRIVIADPGGLPEGAIVIDNIAQIVSLRAATLPVDPELQKINGCAGFVKRAFGVGYQFEPHMPTRGAQCVLYVVRDRGTINWCARLRRTSSVQLPLGTLRLSTDTSQRQVVTGGLTVSQQPEQLAKMSGRNPACDDQGGWLIGGSSIFSAQIEGYLGLSLYGTAQHCVVEWVAVTQTA
jgi:hypothetical protein